MDLAAVPADIVAIGGFRVGDCIGRGAFATVYCATDMETGNQVALKQFDLKALDVKAVEDVITEIRLLRDLRHPNILRVLDVIRQEQYQRVYVVLEFAEQGSLRQKLQREGPMDEPLVAALGTQILQGLAYLHGKSVVHCDIKAANILMTKQEEIKLSDFGISRTLRGQQLAQESTLAGSPFWMSPEAIEMKEITSAVDIWSFACTMVELCTGEPPYFKMNPLTAMYHIVTDIMPPVPEQLSPVLKDLLLLCWRKDPSTRPSARELLQHAFLCFRSGSTAVVQSSSEQRIRVRLDRLGDASLDKIASSLSIDIVAQQSKKKYQRRESKQHDEQHQHGYNFAIPLASLGVDENCLQEFIYELLTEGSGGLLSPENVVIAVKAMGFLVSEAEIQKSCKRLQHISVKDKKFLAAVVNDLISKGMECEHHQTALDFQSLNLSQLLQCGEKLASEEVGILSVSRH